MLDGIAEIEGEYNAKVVALWANNAPVLITRNKAVAQP